MIATVMEKETGTREEKPFRSLREESRTTPLLEIKHLTKCYKNVRALDDVTFSVSQGEFIAVIGPSGSGKTTLIRCINRLIDASGGSISFDNKDLLGLKRAHLRRARARIGMVFQHYNLVMRLTVIENVLHGRLGYKSDFEGMFGIYSEREKERAVEVLLMLDLKDHVYQRCDRLSGGQKQRVGIARALVQDPALILCDEPISSLDPTSAKKIMDHLRKIQRELGITVFTNLHQVDIAKKYAQRILGLRDGKIVYDGPPSGLTRDMIETIYGAEAVEMIDE
jgi:phosphonate transport system ATP-binding protein